MKRCGSAVSEGWRGNPSKRREGDLLVESAGPVRIFFRVRADEDEMRFESQRALLWSIPLPLRIEAWARGAGAGWEFDVSVRHAGGYRGTMAPLP